MRPDYSLATAVVTLAILVFVAVVLVAAFAPAWAQVQAAFEALPR